MSTFFEIKERTKAEEEGGKVAGYCKTDSMCFLKRYALKTAGKVGEIYVYKGGRDRDAER